MGIGTFFKSLLEGGKVDVASRFEILRDAVSGTMSDFHMARDRRSGEIIGLKLLDKQKTEALESRFRGLDKPTEGEISASLVHPRIVTTLSHGLTTKGQQFIVMEFLDGPGLNSLVIGKSPLLDGNRLALMRQAAEAIHFVHESGYIHRDICPRNFVCSKNADSLKLIDFGLTVPEKKEFMQPGIRTGTPNYMAPEVVRRKPTDHRLDIFAFGVSMYEVFAFQLPWQRGSGDGQAAMNNAQTKPPKLSQICPDIDPTVEAAIHRCLEPNPQDRYKSLADFLKAVSRVTSEKAQ